MYELVQQQLLHASDTSSAAIIGLLDGVVVSLVPSHVSRSGSNAHVTKKLSAYSNSLTTHTMFCTCNTPNVEQCKR